MLNWARSSVVEPSSYTRLVAGSIPAAPTVDRTIPLERDFLRCGSRSDLIFQRYSSWKMEVLLWCDVLHWQNREAGSCDKIAVAILNA